MERPSLRTVIAAGIKNGASTSVKAISSVFKKICEAELASMLGSLGINTRDTGSGPNVNAHPIEKEVAS